MHIKRRFVALLFAQLLIWPLSAAVPFWGARQSSPADTPPLQLKPGEWLWNAEAAPAGPIAVVVSLDEQRAYVYRNGLLIGASTVSTGRPGYETPTGVFTILQKDQDHHSSIYNKAAMPYMQRLTWGGVALHAGGLPGYPESHGCVHLPSAFAKELFAVSPMGMTVVVAQQGKSPQDVVHPAALTPIDAGSGREDLQPRLADGQVFRWQPERSVSGPVSLLFSAADRQLTVFRNGVEIGRARIELRDPQTPLGTHVFILKQAAPEVAAQRWTAIGIPGHADEAGQVLDPASIERVAIPAQFLSALSSYLQPGATLLITDAAALPVSERQSRAVLDSHRADASER